VPDTIGVFQIESRAQMQSLLRTRPENLDDLTVQVALVRPGPIQGKAVHPYIEHRQRLREDPSFVPPVDHPLLAEPLADTLGVVVFRTRCWRSRWRWPASRSAKPRACGAR
jgi:error-prone DNA polymerase